MNITITTNDDGDFKIFDGEEELLDFQFEKKLRLMRWGETILNGTKIEIESRQKWWWLINVGNRQADILKNGKIKGQILFHWWRGIQIRLDIGSPNEKKFRLGGKMFRSSIFTIIDSNKNVLAEIKQDFSLRRLKNEYKVKIKNTQVAKNLLVELLIYSIYCAHYVYSRNPAVGE